MTESHCRGLYETSERAVEGIEAMIDDFAERRARAGRPRLLSVAGVHGLVEEQTEGAGQVDPASGWSDEVGVEESDGEDVESDGGEADEGYSVGCEPWWK